MTCKWAPHRQAEGTARSCVSGFRLLDKANPCGVVVVLLTGARHGSNHATSATCYHGASTISSLVLVTPCSSPARTSTTPTA